MHNRLSKREGWLLAFAVLVLVLVSMWQNNQLRDIQHEVKKAHYAERVRTAQLILESELLRAAYFTATDDRTQHLAETYLARFPE